MYMQDILAKANDPCRVLVVSSYMSVFAISRISVGISKTHVHICNNISLMTE